MTENFDLEKIRGDFPALRRSIHGRPLVYLDSAATSLKPQVVVDRLSEYYLNEASNVHRGAHHLAQQGTLNYEAARSEVRDFLNAKLADEIVFTRGTTEAINLVAASYGRKFLNPGDEIILSELEHHSNIVPWQVLAQAHGYIIRVIKIDERGALDLNHFKELLSAKTKMVAVTWISNVLGTVNDVQEITRLAHLQGAKVLIDAAQAAPQLKIDVQKVGCDFLAFSGHKVFAPFGIGALYARAELLDVMEPYQTGGSMIGEVTWEKTTWAALPHKFEAGTPNVGGAMAFGTALRYLRQIGFSGLHAHETDLRDYARASLSEISGVTIYGEKLSEASAIISFNLQGAHASDVGQLLDEQGIAVRAGHHCCQPLMRRLGVPGTARASFSIYNSRSDVDRLSAGLIKAKGIFT